ncbi:cytochrome c550 [Gracilibacillus orientalis]|uniref:Cytochrome c550 n=1 Tax=Gracilibacillus orientalis TaxID=334253 RepID=A0A1I4KST8_9BACI|nr:cytochrome c [Gracilibacillus orientalis]SFL81619.1 cytochrome c550 [Gracilibacillus orientalis]
MKKNPIIPFALIAVLGILAMIILSVVGQNEQEKIANGGDEGETTEAADPEALIQSCIGCHGGDLEGGSGPSLNDVNERLSVEEIESMIINGSDNGNMPGGLVSNEEATVLAEWLSEGQE